MNFSVIGAGNIAFALSVALKNSGHQPVEVYSRTYDNSLLLAKRLNCSAIPHISTLDKNTELIIIAVADDAIPEIAGHLKDTKSLVVHTSGSVGLDALTSVISNAGVIYPFQTISKNRTINFADIPFFIEANTPGNEKKVEDIVTGISGNVYKISSDQRLKLHLAAVFASNFSNHMYHIAYQVMEEAGLDFSVLFPLLEETTRKIRKMHPADAQTGPAKRNDKVVLKKHIDLLSDHPEYQKIYTFVSESIFKHKK